MRKPAHMDLQNTSRLLQLKIILGGLDMKKLSVILMIGSALCYFPSIYADAKKEKQAKIVQKVEDTTKILQDLTHREIDASFLLGQAIENVKNGAIKGSLIEARDDCEKNRKNLADLLHRYGKEAPPHTKDFKGYFMQGYLAMRGWTSDQGLMRALHSNLQILIGAYDDALGKELPDDVKMKVAQIHEIAKDHLRYVASQM